MVAGAMDLTMVATVPATEVEAIRVMAVAIQVVSLVPDSRHPATATVLQAPTHAGLIPMPLMDITMALASRAEPGIFPSDP